MESESPQAANELEPPDLIAEHLGSFTTNPCVRASVWRGSYSIAYAEVMRLREQIERMRAVVTAESAN